VGLGVRDCVRRQAREVSTVPFYAGGVAARPGELKDMFSGLIVESGPMKDWSC
jgi:hypothetical protein